MTPYYERGGITIYCGDCLEVMPWLIGLGLVFDCICADLPYQVTALKWDVMIPFEPLWANYKALVKKNGAVVLFGSEPFSSMLRVSNLEWYKYDWVWDKINPTGFLNANHRPLISHENIVIFCDGVTTFNKQMAGTPKSAQRKNRASHKILDEKHQHKGVYGDSFKGNGYRGDYSNPISLISISTGGPWEKRKQKHPTQKPVKLLQYLTRTYTNPGDLILDNTMGSGTTLLAAQNEGRKAIGIELSEEYCRVAVDRLKQPSFFSIPDKKEQTETPEQMSLIKEKAR